MRVTHSVRRSGTDDVIVVCDIVIGLLSYAYELIILAL